MAVEVGDPISVLYAGGGWDDTRTRRAVSGLDSEPAIQSVSLATTTAVGIERLDSSAVDCVVCEYDAPDIDGDALLEASRAVDDGALPFVGVFDSDDGIRSTAALDAGADRTLRRPTETGMWTDVLAETVRSAVEHHRLIEVSGDAEKRYRSLFENNPLIIWEEDYSASKQRVDELAERVDDLESYFEANPNVVRELMADIDIVDVNQNAVEYYDADSKTDLLDNLDKVFTDTAYDSVTNMWLAIADGATTYRWETVGRTLSGERKHEIIELNVPAEYADDFSRVYVTAMDITERKQHKRELQRQRDRLDEFASVVSHDLRNPLSVAEGHLELATQECNSEHLPKIQQAHERMRTLTADLLTLAREGREVSDPAPVALDETLEDCWDTVETADATLILDTDRVVEADDTRLKQLFENLLRNAVEHGGTDVTVTVGDIDDPTRDGGFFVADDGPGIPVDDRDAVTEAGYTTAEDGNGFGLAIVRQVVEAHDWTLTITDSDQGGARFEITGTDSDLVE